MKNKHHCPVSNPNHALLLLFGLWGFLETMIGPHLDLRIRLTNEISQMMRSHKSTGQQSFRGVTFAFVVATLPGKSLY